MRRNASLVLAGNITSKGFGLLREVLTAFFFGTGSVVASFRVALTGTNVPVNFLTGEALTSAYIPLFKQLSLESRAKAQCLTWLVLAFATPTALAIGLFLWFAANTWVRAIVPGLNGEGEVLASQLLQVMGIGSPLYLMSNVLIFVAMANDDFVPLSCRAVSQNVGLIFGIVAAYWWRLPILFAWGFTGSYALFSSWVAVRELRAGSFSLPRSTALREIRSVLRSFWALLKPLVPLPLFLQGNIVVERVVASLIGVFAISALDYARFVSDTLITIISVPVAYAGLVQWSGIRATDIRKQLQRIVLLVSIVSVPISAVLAANSRLVVQTAFARGAFDRHSVSVTAAILLGASLGLWAQVLGYVLMRALSAQRRNRAVLLIMMAALVGNATFDLLTYSKMGALTLGLGNAIYGAGLLVGTLSALGLWRDFILRARPVVVGGGIYLLIAWYLPLVEGPLWAKAAEAGALAILFWGLWIGALPSLRLAAKELMTGKNQEVV